MLHKLEKEIDDVDAKIGDRWRLLDRFYSRRFLIWCEFHFRENRVNITIYMVLLCRDYDGKVTAEEVASAAMYLKDTLGKEGIQEIISNLSKDRGKQRRIVLLLWLCFLSLLCKSEALAIGLTWGCFVG